jgi:protein Tex
MQVQVAKIAAELSLKEYQVGNVIKLLFEEQCTIPFVARYRKEMTGTMDEVALRQVRDRYQYLEELDTSRAKYLKVVEEHCSRDPKLKEKFPELQRKFANCTTKQELEDLYLPFKPKRRTRAQAAKEKGLERLLNFILDNRQKDLDLAAAALEFVTPADSELVKELRVESIDEALRGAADIFAERLNETPALRAIVRTIAFATGELCSKKAADGETPAEAADSATSGEPSSKAGKKSEAHKYENYFDYREPIGRAPSHRVMAVRRGVAEKILRMSVEVDEKGIRERMTSEVVSNLPTSEVVRNWMQFAVDDSITRLLLPSIETEIRLDLKNRAEEEAIRVFSENLGKLLLLPPIPGKVVMGVDPGLRTGSKLAVVSETGKFLGAVTIYPDLRGTETGKTESARREFVKLVEEHGVSYIAIGNGTGSREIDRFIVSCLKEKNWNHIKRLVVNEAGASVYSTDDIAREEFPDLDPTIRSAISIARRLQDPLAELVKIDPRSIGVGQYQHDVNVTRLKTSLEEVVESCVNKVGVNLNTASYKLLGYVSGIGPTLAKNIVSYRNQYGKFPSREKTMEISGFGPKVYQQCAGFLRVPESANPLDNSGVHPERYDIVRRIVEDCNMELSSIISNRTVLESVPWEKYVTAEVGMPTLRDISSELEKPGRDPREDGTRLVYSDTVTDLEDLKPGMHLKGTVTNVANFGAFVDIGVHQDGLVHISQLSEKFIEDPRQAVGVGDIVDVWVIDVDVAKRRISLTCKESTVKGKGSPSHQSQAANAGAGNGSTNGNGRPRSDSSRPAGGGSHGGNRPRSGDQMRRQAPRPPEPSFTMNDLLSKFNNRK